MQAMVHAKTCIQCGLCPAVCPDVFTLEPGEPARAISGPVPEECRLAAQEAEPVEKSDDAKTCSVCGTVSDSNFCPHCGAPMGK